MCVCEENEPAAVLANQSNSACATSPQFAGTASFAEFEQSGEFAFGYSLKHISSWRRNKGMDSGGLVEPLVAAGG